MAFAVANFADLAIRGRGRHASQARGLEAGERLDVIGDGGMAPSPPRGRLRRSQHGATMGGMVARLRIVPSCLALSLAFPYLAHADDKATARARYETATRLYDVGEYEKALAEFKAAYVAKDDPAFLFNIGQCYRKLGQETEALNFFRRYLKKAPPDDPRLLDVLQ
jgi:tetratricopeptide (TPR) repeat protein